MRNFLALIVFIVLQILFIPLAIIGGGVVGYKQLVVSKRLGVSQTAIEIINGRWIMHIFGLRDDDAAVKLAPALPNTSTTGLWLTLFPLYVHSRILGEPKWFPIIAKPGEETLMHLVNNRTGYFDGIIDRAKNDAEQFVVMGAGLDTRSYNNLKQSGLKMFEVDQKATQQLKKTSLQKAGIDTSHVTFVEANFSQPDWFNGLIDAGYDPEKRTVFLWEGVTLYLGETAVRNTLRTMKEQSAPGSTIVADIYAKRFVTGEYDPRMKAALPILDVTDEAFGFGLDMSSNYAQNLETFITSEGLSVGETHFMGYNTEKGTWMVVAEIKI